jgi:DNA-binding CsgD family transcriptional regulator
MIAPVARRVTSSVLIGRTDALEQLTGALSASRDGRPRHVLVSGEAGVGKTRLVQHAALLAAADGSRVLRGACVSVGDQGLPFAPYAELLRGLVRDEGAATAAALAGRAAADLARLVPTISPTEAPPVQELWAQSRLHEALLDLLRRLAARAPIVVVLEDLHWADLGTLGTTAFLMRAIDDERVSILATLRSDEVTRGHPLRAWLAEAARSERVERLDLEPLDADAVGELVRQITGNDPSRARVEQLYRRSDGNPFFVEELLASDADLGGALTPTLREVLLARVDELPDDARRLLGVAATGGREVDHDLLLAVAGEAPAAGARSVAGIVEAGLLVPVQTAGGDAYAFRHALVQEAVHDALLPTERRRLHRAWGEALEASDGRRPVDAGTLVEVAHHWREARDPRALRASVEAGDVATRGYAVDVALNEYEHALALLEGSADPPADLPDRAELLRRAGHAAYLASEYRRAELATREAIAVLGADGDAARLADVKVQLGRVLWVMGDWQAGIEAYESAVDVAPDGSAARARALAGLAQVSMLHGWHERATALCEEAIVLARSLGARDLEGHALNTLGTSKAGLGRPQEALADIDAALAIAEALDLPDDIGRAHVNRGDILEFGGHPGLAVESTLRGIGVVEAKGAGLSYGVYLRINGTRFAYACGRWDLARVLLAEADRRADAHPGTQTYRAQYALGLLVGSGAPEARETWERTRRLLRASAPGIMAADVYPPGIELLARAGETLEALAAFDEALALLEGTDSARLVAVLARAAAWPAADLGVAARAAGDRAGLRTAGAWFERALGIARAARSGLERAGGHVAAEIDADLAQIEAERSRFEGAPQPPAWAAVGDARARLGRPYLEAYARWREAEAAAATGDRERAADALGEAHAIAARLGAGPLLADVERAARRLRLRLADASPDGAAARAAAPGDAPYGLTPREREVLAEVAAGRTNREIAAALFISESTAGVHVSNILGKLGVPTRAEAGRLALTEGLVSRDAASPEP